MSPNPYLLPEGHVQICFSGGRTSGFLLHSILEANGGLPDRCKVIFTNTGREFEQTLDFVAEVGRRFAVPIVWLEYRPHKPLFEVVGHNSASRDGEPFDALIDRKQYLPNVMSRFCTSELKIRPAKRYLIAEGWRHWHSALGIRADEKRRIRDNPKDRWSNWYPLNDAGVTKADVVAFWRRQPFDLRLENVRGKTPHGNCDGCFLKSEAYLSGLARDFPDRAAWWERAEARIGALETSKGRPVDNSLFSQRLSRQSLRRFVDRQGSWIFKDEAFLCQRDDGECF